MKTPYAFEGRSTLVTGAGSGIGQALAVRLAEAGARLVLVDRDAPGLARTQALLAVGTETLLRPLDVTDPAAIQLLKSELDGAWGGVDVLINNAGIALGGTFEQVAEADFARVIDVNFWGVVRMTRAFLPLLKRSPEARLVNLSSLYGIISPPGQAAYSASKFAVRAFSNALALELAGTTVGVTVVHPGGVATAIAASAKRPAGVSATEADAERREIEKMLRLPPDKAAEVIIDGVRRRRARIIVGGDAKLVSLVERLFPTTHMKVLARLAGRKGGAR